MLVETQYFVVMSKLFTKQQNVKPVQIQSISKDKLKLIKTAKTVLDKIENTVGKEENAGYQHFLLFPQCFQKA